MARGQVLNDAVKWFEANYSKYVKLGQKVEDIIKEALESEIIAFQSISSRPKSIDGLKKKLLKISIKILRQKLWT